jgi:hypothetical protein
LDGLRDGLELLCLAEGAEEGLREGTAFNVGEGVILQVGTTVAVGRLVATNVGEAVGEAVMREATPYIWNCPQQAEGP